MKARALVALPVLGQLLAPGCAWISDSDLAARRDVDGDGVARPADCDDRDAGVGVAYVDADSDGHGGSSALGDCASSDGPVLGSDDCNDGDAEAFPGAAERCNGLDDDCDGSVDEDSPEATDWYADADGDTFGDVSTRITACDAPRGFVSNASDCDDADPSINPSVLVYRDADGDDYGDPASTVSTCDDTTGFIEYAGDCDDTRADVNPEGVEVCDDADVDEDCDGLADDADPVVAGPKSTFYVDADGDGVGTDTTDTEACDLPDGYSADRRDCDDADPSVTLECVWIDVAASGDHTCGLLGTGAAVCWGIDAEGANAPPSGTFVDIDGSNTSSDDWTCGVLSDGTLACWGVDPQGYGLLSPPAGVFVSVSVGGSHACALDAAGEAQCWGDATDGATSPPAGPFVAVVAGPDGASAALRADGSVAKWGLDTGLPGDASVTGLALGLGFGCTLDGAGHVACGGDGGFDSERGGWSWLTATADTTCAMAPDGLWSCAGGHGTFGAGYYVSVDAGDDYACGLKSTGSIGCYGTCGEEPTDWCTPPS